MKITDKNKIKVLNFIHDTCIAKRGCKIYKNRHQGVDKVLYEEEKDFSAFKKYVNVKEKKLGYIYDWLLSAGYLHVDMFGFVSLTKEGNQYMQKLQEAQSSFFRSLLISIITSLITSILTIIINNSAQKQKIEKLQSEIIEINNTLVNHIEKQKNIS